MANIGYPLDLSGTLPENKVAETRTLSAKAIDGRAFIIPRAAPFFARSVLIVHNNRTLVDGIDYHVILDSAELSQNAGLQVSGGILFNTVSINDAVTITVQTIGGNFNIPIGNTLESTVNLIRNPIFTTWSQIVGTPQGLPPRDHVHDFNTMAGYEELIKALASIDLNLIGAGGGAGNEAAVLAALRAHLESTAAHTPSAVGLGKVANYSPATDADFNGDVIPNDKYVTPRGVLFALNKFTQDFITAYDSTLNSITTALANNSSEFADLKRSWTQLQEILGTINSNYGATQDQVQNLATALSNAVNDISTTNRSLEQTNVGVQGVVAMLNRIIAKLYYPEELIVVTGSSNFTVKPNDSYSIILIGAGGGCGDYNESLTGYLDSSYGSNGGDTTLWNLTTPMQPIAIARAGGGRGTSGSVIDATGAVITYARGGFGGKTYNATSSLITLVEAADGIKGTDGFGPYVTGNNHITVVGTELLGNRWGAGASGNTIAGRAGSGGYLSITLTNPTAADIEFSVTVGNAGQSHVDNQILNATGGLAVIKKTI